MGITSNFLVPIASAIEILILSFCYQYARKSTRPLARQSLKIVISVMCLIAFKTMIFVVPNELIASIMFTLYELTHIWTYLSFADYVISMSGKQFTGITKSVFIFLSVIDTLIFIINLFTGIVFDFDINSAGAVHVNIHSAYLYHFLLKCSILLFIIIHGVLKIKRSHHIYWMKYLIVTVSTVVLFFTDMLRTSRVSASILASVIFTAITVILFLIAIVTKIKILRSYEYAEVFDTMAQYIFLIDNNGECTLVNKGALEFFELDEFDLSDIGWKVFGIVDRQAVKKATEYTQKCRYMKDDEIYHLRLDYQKIFHNGVFAGEIYGFTDVTKETKLYMQEQRLARYDSFTKVYNQEYFYNAVADRIEYHPDKEYYIIGSDIRDFKVFNDVFGKEAGDAIILKCAAVLRELYNDGKIDVFGRIYADRFGMMVDKERFSENAIVNKFLEIDHPFNEEYYHLNIHFGVYRTNMDVGLPVKSMFDRAYVALDAIKNDVNIRLYHYNEIMRDEKIWEQTISSNIERALKEGQLRIVVQPQVDRDEKVIGGEALVRWRHPENGEISPGNFIPILEKTGLVTNADIYVWEESCKLLARWKSLGFEDYYVSVNISPTDFVFTDIFAIFTELVQKYDINPKNLKLEITETAMMSDVLERIVLIKRLEEYGFTVELDDFGSGYSSLNMLKEIPVDVIKMDMKFLYNYNDESTKNSRKVIGHIIQMAKDLQMQIVAEGVETKDQLGFLMDSGCDVFQGYFFSKPIEVEQFEQNQGIA